MSEPSDMMDIFNLIELIAAWLATKGWSQQTNIGLLPLRSVISYTHNLIRYHDTHSKPHISIPLQKAYLYQLIDHTREALETLFIHSPNKNPTS